MNWGERRGLNPRPSVPQTDALPAELRSPPSDSSSLHYLQGAATASVFRRIFVPNREFRLCVQIRLFARMRKRFLGAGTSKFRGIWAAAFAFTIDRSGPSIAVPISRRTKPSFLGERLMRLTGAMSTGLAVATRTALIALAGAALSIPC